MLRFGTAGIRGLLGTDPDELNENAVAAVAAGIATWLTPGASVIVGHDARHGSPQFAAVIARTLRAHGITDVVAGQVPTPVLAFTARRGDYSAGVMVTASHNPARYNGIKVFDGSGAQLDDEQAAEVERAIAAPRGQLAQYPLMRRSLDAVPAYLGALPTVAAGPIRIAYTPLHGVGGAVVLEALHRSGFDDIHVVGEQYEPDPAFPTTPFPNPEEPETLDRLRTLCVSTRADIGLANDPDADRLAVVVGNRQLTGDEIGLLLADEVLRTRPGPVATTVVSSPVLGVLAGLRGVPYAETLTGFKNLVRAHGGGLTFAYEEALGYAVAPATVRDKDGISAALLVASMAAAERARGRTLLDRLADLETELGAEVATAQISIPADDPTLLLGRLTSSLPQGFTVTRSDPLTIARDDRRVIVRASGTEPKVKAYLHATHRAELPSLAETAGAWLAAATV